MTVGYVAILLSAVITLLVPGAESLKVVVPSGATECFFYHVEQDVGCTGTYEVVQGRPLAINVKVSGADHEYYSATDEMKDQFQFFAKSTGQVEVCFHTPSGSSSSKSVAFGFHTDDAPISDDHRAGMASADADSEEEANRVGPTEYAAKKSHIKELAGSIENLNEGIEVVRDELLFYRSRSREMTETTESTSTRVFAWAALEVLLVFGLSMWQMTSIRNTFEVKRMI